MLLKQFMKKTQNNVHFENFNRLFHLIFGLTNNLKNNKSTFFILFMLLINAAARFEMLRGLAGLVGECSIWGRISRHYGTIISKQDGDFLKRLSKTLRTFKQPSRDAHGGTMVVKQSDFHNSKAYDELV